MIDEKFLEQLKKDYNANESQRRQIISAANGILFEAKKTIFALQRQDFELAATKITDIEKSLKDLEGRFGFERLHREGAYKQPSKSTSREKLFTP